MRAIKLIAALLAGACCLALIAGEARRGQPGKETKSMSEDREIMAVLSCFGYGYKVKMLVNGIDIGIVGGKSENRRLFNQDSEMAAMAVPEIRKKNFPLVNGQNMITVEFAKESANQDDKLEITLEMENYPAPLFRLVTTKKSGRIEKPITIQNAVPAGFKTVEVKD